MPPFDAIAPKHRIFQDVCWAHADYELSAANYDDAARRLGCETAAIKAVTLTEVHGRTWDRFSRPLVLFERHQFARLTHGRFNRTHPDISNSLPGGYGRSDKQYERLRRAALLDEHHALEAASWGMFQIMGFNAVKAGFGSVEAMVDAMLLRASAHLDGFVALIASDHVLLSALKEKNWASFARHYNGPNYAENDYDAKIRANYDKLTAARQ